MYFSYVILLSTLIFLLLDSWRNYIHLNTYITPFEEAGFYSSETTRNVFAILYIPSSRAWWILWSFESFPSNVCLEVCALMRSSCSFGFCYFISPNLLLLWGVNFSFSLSKKLISFAKKHETVILFVNYKQSDCNYSESNARSFINGNIFKEHHW